MNRSEHDEEQLRRPSYQSRDNEEKIHTKRIKTEWRRSHSRSNSIERNLAHKKRSIKQENRFKEKEDDNDDDEQVAATGRKEYSKISNEAASAWRNRVKENTKLNVKQELISSVESSEEQKEDDDAKPLPKASFSLQLSGKLAKAANSLNGVALKYSEPKDAKIPDKYWRLYVFKNGSITSEPLRIHRQSKLLIGRDEKVCDLPLLHHSISKQHAVIQFRLKSANKGKNQEESDVQHRSIHENPQIVPYIIDLESTNGTFLNAQRLESARFVELREKDTLQFGESTREYVLLHSGSVLEGNEEDKQKLREVLAGKTTETGVRRVQEKPMQPTEKESEKKNLWWEDDL